MVSLSQKLLYLYPDSVPMVDWVVRHDGNGEYIYYWNPALGPQPTQAELDAITEAQVIAAADTHYAQTEKAEATKSVDEATQIYGNRVERALISVATSAVKVVNNDRITLGQMNAAVQAASSLADLKARFATINFPPQITMQQLKDSIKADIAATPE